MALIFNNVKDFILLIGMRWYNLIPGVSRSAYRSECFDNKSHHGSEDKNIRPKSDRYEKKGVFLFEENLLSSFFVDKQSSLL
jgi:hypothetical protein